MDEQQHDMPVEQPTLVAVIEKDLVPAAPSIDQFKRPPKVGDRISHDGKEAVIVGTQIRGPRDFSVTLDSGETISSR